MAALNDSEIAKSWHINAGPWINIIDHKGIESRNLATNAAIIEAVKLSQPENILDIGCGEGWLERELNQKQLHVFGIDVVPELVKKAQENNSGTYDICAYEDLEKYDFGGLFDCVICNFSLIGKESTEAVFKKAATLLNDRPEKPGRFIVQTLHPLVAGGDLPYQDGWREGSWAGFGEEFSNPAPWYFRTIGSWIDLFLANQMQVVKISEPLHPKTAKPASIIFESVAAR